MNHSTLGHRIKHLRKEANLTQSEFGKIFNLGKSTVSQYESGKSRPDDELKKKIAKHFDVSLDWLMGLTENRIQYVDNPSSFNEDQSISVDDELRELLTSNEFRDVLVAFHDYKNWTDEDKREVINFIKFKRSQNK